MTPRLVILALPLFATACVIEEDDAFEELPPYEESTGAGKTDDANCTDATYRDFVKEYRQGRKTAEQNPCINGNDASFRIWAFAVGKQLEPTLTAYTAMASKRFNDRSVTNEQLAAAGTITAAQRAELAKLAKIKPLNAGRVGYGAWVEFLYKPAAPLATRAIGNRDVSPDAINQVPRQITTYEDEWLKIVEQGQPKLTGGGSFAIWQTVAQKDLDDARTGFGEHDRTWLARLAEVAPKSTFDADGGVFQDTITLPAANAVSSTVKAAPWVAALKVKPPAGGRTSYGKWVTAFVKVAEGWNQRARNDEEKQLFTAIIAAKPCASGTDGTGGPGGSVDDVVARVRTALATAGTDPAGAKLVDVAVPTPCAPQ